ncbi:MAG: isoprenylcysteine carboxylmethyltransferase family protein [Pseudomonadota bacterium]
MRALPGGIRRALHDPRVAGLARLVRNALSPPPGLGRICAALGAGVICHAVFAVAVLAMIWAMFFGMSRSLGIVPWPWAGLANAALLAQFPLVHSALLSPRGTRLVARLVPGPHGRTLATTTYALIASLQLLALFTLWTPSGVIWWQAEGAVFWVICAAYAGAWLLLVKASFDAGAEVQSGALGWMSMLAARAPVFPDMPTLGLFRRIRQPIYVAFALTLWTVPVWTPDQLALALSYTAYCLCAPRLKEARFATRYGLRFERYRARVPYIVPRWRTSAPDMGQPVSPPHSPLQASPPQVPPGRSDRA